MSNFLQKVLDWKNIQSWCNGRFSLLGHNHDSNYARIGDTGLINGSLPDFSRAITMFVPVNYRFRCPIIKVNVPGYLMYQQLRRMLDADMVCYAANHPGYLFEAYNESITLRANGTSSSGTILGNWTNRTILFGDALNGGDTFMTHYWPINPGTNTYIQLNTDLVSTTGYQYYRFIFIPIVGLDSTISANKFITKVGMSIRFMSDGADSNDRHTAELSLLASSIFSGDWKTNLLSDNAVYIPTLFVSGTSWNWATTYNNSNEGGNYGRRFHMVNPLAINSNRRWAAYDDLSALQIYYDTNQWVLCNGNTQYYRAPGDINSNPWELTWYADMQSGHRVVPNIIMKYTV